MFCPLVCTVVTVSHEVLVFCIITACPDHSSIDLQLVHWNGGQLPQQSNAAYALPGVLCRVVGCRISHAWHTMSGSRPMTLADQTWHNTHYHSHSSSAAPCCLNSVQCNAGTPSSTLSACQHDAMSCRSSTGVLVPELELVAASTRQLLGSPQEVLLEQLWAGSRGIMLDIAICHYSGASA